MGLYACKRSTNSESERMLLLSVPSLSLNHISSLLGSLDLQSSNPNPNTSDSIYTVEQSMPRLRHLGGSTMRYSSIQCSCELGYEQMLLIRKCACLTFKLRHCFRYGWGLCMGLFIACISCGHKLRDIFLNSCIVPSVYTLITFCTLGGIGLCQGCQAQDLCCDVLCRDGSASG
jgi:BCCT, betaine/carnitine/choline family transporter